MSPLAKLCRDLLKSPVIPFAPAERQQRFPEPLEKLADYIAAHEQLAKEKEAAKADQNEAPALKFGDDAELACS